MTLTESQQNLMAQALYLAADKYLDFAADAQEIGNVRIMEQFLRQATETLQIAMLADNCDTVAFSNEMGMADASPVAVGVANEKFAKLLKLRNAEREADDKW